MNIIIHASVMVFGVIIASVAQVLLKKSAQKEYKNKIMEYLNWQVIMAYSMMIIATMCTVFAYKAIHISLAMVLDATGYIFVTLFGFFIFNEKVTMKRLFALSLIIIGIAVYALLG